MSEFKHLRKIEFPESMMEGFRYLERLVAQDYARSSLPNDLFCAVADEFIFLEVDRTNNRPRRLTPVQELQVLEKMTSYFNESKTEMQHVLFLWLFAPGRPLSDNKLSLLTKLISMAVTDTNANVLNDASMWMQISDCGSPASLRVVETIIRDYFLLMPSLTDNLRKLPFTSTFFCSSFLCALTVLYKPTSNLLIPQRLMEVILEWLAAVPALYFSPLKVASPYKLANPQTPIPGLIYWCVRQPLLSVSCDPLLFSRLHLTLLEFLLHIGHLEPGLPPGKVLPLAVMVHMIGQVWSPKVEESYTQAQNRLAQVVHVALCSGCLQPSPELFAKLASITNNRLVTIILDKWKVS